MAKAVFDELGRAAQAPLHRRHLRRRDLAQPGLGPDFRPPRPASEVQAVFFGLGSDGTVGANKNSAKIIVEGTGAFVQGYFVYDSKKSGAMTVSHLRFGPEPIRSTYLITDADFVACHQFGLLKRVDVLEAAPRTGATFLLNSPYGADEVWDQLPGEVQRQLRRSTSSSGSSTPTAVAAEAQLGNRINTVMQPCFFALSGDACPSTRRSPRSRRRSTRPTASAARPSSSATSPPSTAALANLARVEIPPRTGRSGLDRRRDPRVGTRNSSRKSPRCSWPARATCCRSPPSRRTAVPHLARPATRSGPSPPRCRSGTRTSASTAASAPSSARTPPSA